MDPNRTVPTEGEVVMTCPHIDDVFTKTHWVLRNPKGFRFEDTTDPDKTITVEWITVCSGCLQKCGGLDAPLKRIASVLAGPRKWYGKFNTATPFPGRGN